MYLDFSRHWQACPCFPDVNHHPSPPPFSLALLPWSCRFAKTNNKSPSSPMILSRQSNQPSISHASACRGTWPQVACS